MFIEIYVKNFILMDEVRLNFKEHMSCFTGETGAGKSLLMDAIGILKGDRINASMIKEGKNEAFIEGVFEIAGNHSVLQKLIEAGIPCEEHQLIVNRIFNKEGKSSTRLNQRNVSVSFLKEIVGGLVDIHSQHDTQYLLNAKYHRQLLDKFCNAEELVQQVQDSFTTYKKIADDLESALHQDYNEDSLEFLNFQYNEIEEANIQPGELEELESELKRIGAYEKISSKVHNSVDMLEEQGGLSNLYDAYKELNSLHEDEFFSDISEKILDAYYSVEECLAQCKDHIDSLEYDEAHFNEVQERIFLIHKMLRKYGPNVASVLEQKEELAHKIDSIEHRQEYLEKQEKLVKEAYDQFLEVANKLHDERVSKAKKLEKLVLLQLLDLELANAKFHIEIQEAKGNIHGIDTIEFMISMNRGEPLKPLSTSASGGELSRFMLGMKTVFSSLQGIETIIFDEIDTGVSGSVGFAVGKKMQELGQHIQVFAVTHLASVAACAKQHYIVEKKQTKDSTITNIRLLNDTQRVQELALIASNSTSQTAIQAAQELFDKAQ
ncbi:MAG: DNA repair protein RecN [Longicatena sp.]